MTSEAKAEVGVAAGTDGGGAAATAAAVAGTVEGDDLVAVMMG